MNRWLRTFGAIFILISANSAVFAVCEAEEEKVRTLVSVDTKGDPSFMARYPEMRRRELSTNESYYEQIGALERTKLEESLLSFLKLPTGARTERDRADYGAQLCQLRNFKTRSGGSSAINKPDNSSSTTIQPQPNQSAQQQSQQAQQRAAQNQARADQARQGKRKTHDPAAEAHQCIDVDTKTLYGGFKNKCSYPVTYGYCVDNPKKGAWTDSPLFSCAGMTGKQTAGGQTIKANGYDANHTKGGETVYFFACKDPAHAMDLTFIPGQGIQGRCMYF